MKGLSGNELLVSDNKIKKKKKRSIMLRQRKIAKLLTVLYRLKMTGACTLCGVVPLYF